MELGVARRLSEDATASCSCTTTATTTTTTTASLDTDWGDFHQVVLIFTMLMVLIFVVQGSLIAYANKRRGEGFKFQLVVDTWPWQVRDLVAFIVLLFIWVPVVDVFVSVVFGGLLATAEGWTFHTGFEYILSNVAALEVPLTAASPDTTGGDIIDIILSLWTMLLASIFMGIAGCLQSVSRVTESMPDSLCGLLRYVLLWIPMALVLVALVCGGALAAVEEWSFATGFLFVVSSLCGLENPLVDNAPTTPIGIFVELMAISIELTLGGAIIGVVAAHPWVMHLLTFLEGATAAQESLDMRSAIQQGLAHHASSGDLKMVDLHRKLGDAKTPKQQQQAIALLVKAACAAPTQVETTVAAPHAERAETIGASSQVPVVEQDGSVPAPPSAEPSANAVAPALPKTLEECQERLLEQQSGLEQSQRELEQSRAVVAELRAQLADALSRAQQATEALALGEARIDGKIAALRAEISNSRSAAAVESAAPSAAPPAAPAAEGAPTPPLAPSLEAKLNSTTAALPPVVEQANGKPEQAVVDVGEVEIARPVAQRA